MGGERHRRDAVSPELFGSSRYRRGGDWRGLGRADGLCARRRGLGRAARAIGGLAPAEGARGPGSDEGAADGSGAGGDNEAPALSGVGVLRRRRVIRPGTRRWTVMMGIHGYAGNSSRVMERITLAGPRLGGRVWVGGCGWAGVGGRVWWGEIRGGGSAGQWLDLRANWGPTGRWAERKEGALFVRVGAGDGMRVGAEIAKGESEPDSCGGRSPRGRGTSGDAPC